ncbi:MAG: hypothetical protein L0H53_16135 [Candidatus Nitrosocosmicus sp.]|nr:hypothetical protein [Candidatus Nitrosocosmicus sp.]
MLFGSATTLAYAQNPSLSKTYSNAMCGLSINYPDNWVVEESNMKFGNLFDMAEIKPNTPDGFKNTVALEAQGISIYPDKSIEGIAEFMEFYHAPDMGDTIIQSNRIDIPGTPAHEIVYEYMTSKGDIWKDKEVYIPSENTLYVIRYNTVGLDYYDKYSSIVDDMIQSVKVDGRVC